MSRAQTSAPSQSTGSQAGSQSYGSQSSSTSQSQVAHDKIAMRAYEKWCRRGRPHGTDKQDWIEAETELRQEMSRGATAARR